MLGTLAFIAMRQQHHQTTHSQPFAFARRDELIDDHLRAIDEIAELSLPDRERIGLGQRIAVFEPEHGLFGQHRIDDLVAGLPVNEVVERGEGGFVFLVVEHRMALGERAALHILARKADRMAIFEQRGKTQRFGGGPVDPLPFGDHLLAVVEEALDGAVSMEIARHAGQSFAKRLEPVHIDTGDTTARAIDFGELDVFPGTVEPVGLVGAIILPRLELGLEPGAPVGLELVEVFGGKDALIDQLAAIDVQRRLVTADGLVHERLGKAGLVAFIVSEPAVAEHVDNDRTAELLAELGGDLCGIDHSFRIVPIAMEDRGFDHLGHIGRVRRGPREMRTGGEPDLVVDHEVDRPAGAVALQTRKPETLGHDALPGKGRIAMQQQRQHRGAVGVARVGNEPAVLCRKLVLLGARFAQNYRIHDFQMAGVGGKRKMHRIAVELTVRRCAKVIFDVARPFHVVRVERATLELVKQGAMGLGH